MTWCLHSVGPRPRRLLLLAAVECLLLVECTLLISPVCLGDRGKARQLRLLRHTPLAHLPVPALPLLPSLILLVACGPHAAAAPLFQASPFLLSSWSSEFVVVPAPCTITSELLEMGGKSRLDTVQQGQQQHVPHHRMQPARAFGATTRCPAGQQKQARTAVRQRLAGSVACTQSCLRKQQHQLQPHRVGGRAG